MAANDVIPFSLFRQFIQDSPQEGFDTLLTDGVTKSFQLSDFPVIVGTDTPFSLSLTDISPDELGEYKLTEESGRIRFTTSPPVGVMEVEYFYAQLGDKELELCLNNALMQHSPTMTWDTFDTTQTPYVMWLAASNAYYMLASRWATQARMKVETVEIHSQEIASRYFALAQQMSKQYHDASAGIIEVGTLTRRDSYTGLLVPFYPEDEVGEQVDATP